MSQPEFKAVLGDGSAPRGRPARALRWTTRQLGRLGLAGASAVLVAVAVLLGEIAHYGVGALLGHPFSLAFAFEVAVVAALVAAPIIVYAQLVIRELGDSRRALRNMAERLAIAVDGAEQANIAKSQFLANMSHELRTPLNAIIGFSDMIQAQTFGPVGSPRYLDYLKDISQSGHHLLRIINDILDLSKIEAGRASVHDEEEFPLAAAIEATTRMMRPLAERERVALEAPASATGLRLVAVERMVCQILINLLSNAVKFTPAGGRVSLSAARTPEGGLLLAVTDSGVGMAPNEIKVALTPFGQVSNALSRKHTGTGLGLPLAKAMMELHGGTLRIASAPGQGTTVSLYFPPERVVAGAPVAAAAPAAGEQPAPPQQSAGAPAPLQRVA
jgi:signal transduction histidine kinase